ncbi:MAG: hypothetical protein ACYDDO_13875 [Acidiferrobacterales bacterium]
MTDRLSERKEVIPNAACVVALVDRLVHNAEVLAIGVSFAPKNASGKGHAPTPPLAVVRPGR